MIPVMSLVVTRGFGRSHLNTIEAGPVTIGYGRTKILVPTRILEPGLIDSRPLLFPPDVFVGGIPVGIPTIDASAMLYLPLVRQISYLDIVSMVLGIRPMLDSFVGVVTDVAEILSVATQPSFILSVEDDAAGFVESASLVMFTVGVNMGVSVNMGIGQAFDEPMGIDDSFDQNLTQTLDY
jgi:hypothetical protein